MVVVAQLDEDDCFSDERLVVARRIQTELGDVTLGARVRRLMQSVAHGLAESRVQDAKVALGKLERD